MPNITNAQIKTIREALIKSRKSLISICGNFREIGDCTQYEPIPTIDKSITTLNSLATAEDERDKDVETVRKILDRTEDTYSSLIAATDVDDDNYQRVFRTHANIVDAIQALNRIAKREEI